MTDVSPSGENTTNAASVLQQRVRQAQADLLYGRSQTLGWAGAAFALLVAVGLLPYADARVIWAWFALRCAVSAGRWWLHRAYKQSAQRDRAGWSTRLVIALGVDGFSWSVIALWLLPQDIPGISVLMLAAMVGVASVGIFVLQASWRASAVFLAGMLVPVALLEFTFLTRNGFFIGAGLLMYVVLLLVEVRHTERRILELIRLRFSTDRIAEERAEALQLAERQSSVKGQFLATMSHEMRTPLHGILGLTRSLRQSEPHAQSLVLIERAGEHLLTLINDALDFSKLEAGQVQLSPLAFDLAALIDDVVSLLVPSATEAGLLLNTRFHMPRPCHVFGDPARVRQILHNLVGNAIKFTDTGAVTVVAKHSESRGRARIAVHDTGVGIAPEQLSVIFDAFHQADGSFTRRYSGTGLGLTIARELARAMGGDLVVTSQLGKGSCFTVTLDLPRITVDVPLEIADAPLPGTLKGSVLLAEDNPVNALVAEAVLKKLGLDVTVVADGLQAFDAYRSARPDVVLLDCQMPVMDGHDAARHIRAHEVEQGWSRTPVIALTANAFAGDREQSLAAGMDDHLAKPFKDEDLARILAKHLAKG